MYSTHALHSARSSDVSRDSLKDSPRNNPRNRRNTRSAPDLQINVPALIYLFSCGRLPGAGTSPSSVASFAFASCTTEILPSVAISSPVALFNFRGALGLSTSAYASPVPMKSRSVVTQSRSLSTCGSIR